ncbi:MAG: hypothetical protein IPO83_03715 [Chitinophagaceae bacterium]|nr:hypothetical protein [Chitinophagaceae bacterium]
MLIEEKALKHWIDNFYGYGSWDATIWFIGYEENGGDVSEEVTGKVNYFYKVYAPTDATLCDIRELYRQVAISLDDPKSILLTNRCEYRFGKNAVQNVVWKNLVAFQYGYRNEILPDFLEYQKHTFASPSEHNEVLICLYPLLYLFTVISAVAQIESLVSIAKLI